MVEKYSPRMAGYNVPEKPTQPFFPWLKAETKEERIQRENVENCLKLNKDRKFNKI